MKLLNEIVCRDGAHKEGKTIYREAVRAIIRRQDQLFMIFSTQNGDYKFPGGGIEAGEGDHDALVREVQEEGGVTIDQFLGEFGQMIEYDIPIEPDFDVFKMVSRYYICTVHDGSYAQKLDPYEQDLGFQPVWVDITTAIQVNSEVLLNQARPAPRWTKRDTYVLQLLQNGGR